MSDEKKEKDGSFDPGCITDIQDKLLSHNYVLRAFATLLTTSGLSDFATQYPTDVHSDSNHEAEALRFGLSQIIDLYLAHQESILAEYVDQYHKSDIALVRWAKFAIESVERRAFCTKEGAIKELREAVANLDTVINRDGELKGKADEMKETCMKYLKQMTEKVKECG